jgi:TetR/AcrR family transcriptional repressor of bet genes
MYCKDVPKRVDHEQRRAEIVRALWTVINGRGIEGVTYQAVAGAAGISVGRVQHYFDSKEELVRAGCRAIVERATRTYSERVRSLDPWSALLELLTEPIPRTETFRRGAAVWYAYIARGVVDPEIGEIVSDASRGTVAEAASLLESAHAPPSEAERLVGLSNGLTQRVLIGATTSEEALTILRDEVAGLKARSA